MVGTVTGSAHKRDSTEMGLNAARGFALLSFGASTTTHFSVPGGFLLLEFGPSQHEREQTVSYGMMVVILNRSLSTIVAATKCRRTGGRAGTVRSVPRRSQPSTPTG